MEDKAEEIRQSKERCKETGLNSTADETVDDSVGLAEASARTSKNIGQDSWAMRLNSRTLKDTSRHTGNGKVGGCLESEPANHERCQRREIRDPTK